MRYQEPLTPMESADLASPSADHSNRFPLDDLLRARQYVVTDRTNVGPVRWAAGSYSGPRFTQTKLLELEGLIDDGAGAAERFDLGGCTGEST